jgi:hypothetical protein
MNHLCSKSLGAMALGVLAAIGTPSSAQAQGMYLKQGWNYTIGFPETTTAPESGLSKGAATYRVLASAGDQQWYRVQMVARKPQGGWYVPQGTPEVWVNLNYAMWVQEVIR